jgi:hypothetical protein
MVRVASEESKDERFTQSLADAECTIDQLAERIANGSPAAHGASAALA